MEEMLIINPRRARNSKGRFTKRRHNARRRRVSARKRRRNPIAAIAVNPRRRRRRNPIAAVAAVNPRRRRRRNPIAMMNPRRRKRRYHNPRGMALGAFKPRAILNAIIPAGVGALGAIGLDIAMSYVPLPAQFQTGIWRNVARIVGAVGLGVVAGMVVGRQKGSQVALGALTVVSYSIVRDVVKEKFPQLNLSGAETYDYSDLRIGYINPAAMVTGSGVGAYMNSPVPNSGVGAYMGRGGLDTVNSLSGVVGDGL